MLLYWSSLTLFDGIVKLAFNLIMSLIGKFVLSTNCVINLAQIGPRRVSFIWSPLTIGCTKKGKSFIFFVNQILCNDNTIILHKF